MTRFQRVGPHVQGAMDADAKRWIGCAPIVKTIDDPAPLLLAHDNALRVFRAYLDEAGQSTITARSFLDLVLVRLQGYRHPLLYVEGLNEYNATMATGFAYYLDWTASFVELAHVAGLKVAGISAPTGNLDEPEIALLVERRFCGMDALSAHHYWGAQGFTEWNALRYRRWRQQGVTLPILITEAGRDAVEGFEPIEGVRPATAGWKVQNVGLSAYQTEWATYDVELAKDQDVYGVGFTLSDNSRWANFELNSSAAWFAERTQPPTKPIVLGESLMPERTESQQNEIINMIAQQNTYLTEALKRFRQGKFAGADGIDALIVALQGGQPLDFAPSYPPK